MHSHVERVKRLGRKKGEAPGRRNGWCRERGVSVFLFLFSPPSSSREVLTGSEVRRALAAAALGVLGHLSSIVRARERASERERKRKPRLEKETEFEAFFFSFFESEFFFFFFFFNSFSNKRKKKETNRLSRPPLLKKKRSALSIK